MQFARWGNSLALRIPAVYAKEIGACENGKAEVTVEDGKLVVVPLQDAPGFNLDELVAQITDENRHEEIETGSAVGDEFS